MEEILKMYFADKEGRIYSQYFRKHKEIKPRVKPNGYLKFNAYSSNGVKTVHVHRFVWTYHFGKIPEGMTINHRNFDKADNRLSNLELLSGSDNTKYSARAGRFKNNGKHAVGSGNGRSVLTEKRVKTIKRRLDRGESASALAREYEIGKTAVHDIKSEKSWKHLWER